jgi:hypothetical protein
MPTCGITAEVPFEKTGTPVEELLSAPRPPRDVLAVPEGIAVTVQLEPKVQAWPLMVVIVDPGNCEVSASCPETVG